MHKKRDASPVVLALPAFSYLHVVKHTLKEMGFNVAGVTASIKRRNEFVKTGKDADLDRTTFGGLKSEAKMRILNTEVSPSAISMMQEVF